MKKVLITGGTGFIGYHLAKRLVALGQDVTIVDNFFRSEKDEDLLALLQKPNIKLVEADLTVSENWGKLGVGYDYVYHLVGINGTKLFYEIPYEVLRIGLLTTLNAIEWFRTTNNRPDGKILYTSSNELYAGTREAFGDKALPIPTDEKVPGVISDIYNPRWSYAGQKLIGEMLFIHSAKAFEFRMSIVRPHNFYGPRAGYHHVIPELIEKIDRKMEPFPIYGIQEKRSFCYIDDAVEAIQMVMESSKTDGGTFHIGSHEERKVINLVETLFSLLNWKPKERDIKDPLPGSVTRRVPDISKIKEFVGWEPKTSFEDGLQKTIEWYLKHPNPKKK